MKNKVNQKQEWRSRRSKEKGKEANVCVSITHKKKNNLKKKRLKNNDNNNNNNSMFKSRLYHSRQFL